jgi:hypothetical protein
LPFALSTDPSPFRNLHTPTFCSDDELCGTCTQLSKTGLAGKLK